MTSPPLANSIVPKFMGNESPEPNLLLDKWIFWINQVKASQAAVVLFVYFAAVFWLDYFSGDEMVLAMLYLPVVAFVTVRLSLGSAINLSLVCSVIWLVDDVVIESQSLQMRTQPGGGEVLSACVHFMCFTTLATVLSRLNVALRREHRIARYDHLTGLPNVRMFRIQAEAILAGAQSERPPFTLVFVDCDNFKTVNDTSGHEEGNRVLQVISEGLQSQLRLQDCVARYGGDEFVMILPETDLDQAVELVQRIRRHLLNSMSTHDWPVTFSVGLATFRAPPSSLDEAIRIADELMYDCKRNGKNGTLTRLV